MLDHQPIAKANALPADWSLHEDNRLRGVCNASGVMLYARLAALSEEWQITERALQARLHRLGRAGGDESNPDEVQPAVLSESEAFAAVLAVVTPSMVNIAHALRRADWVSSCELGARTERPAQKVSAMIRQNRDRIRLLGFWRLEARQVPWCNKLRHEFRLTFIHGADT